MQSIEPLVLADGGRLVVGFLFVITPFWVAPLVGVMVYTAIRRRYRNMDKRHEVERLTRVEVYGMDHFDNRVSNVHGTHRLEISDRNDHQPLRRVRRFDP